MNITSSVKWIELTRCRSFWRKWSSRKSWCWTVERCREMSRAMKHPMQRMQWMMDIGVSWCIMDYNGIYSTCFYIFYWEIFGVCHNMSEHVCRTWISWQQGRWESSKELLDMLIFWITDCWYATKRHPILLIEFNQYINALFLNLDHWHLIL